MKITYHGHACFSVESNSFVIVLDPYKGVRGFGDVDLCANMVLCSHGHGDHSFVDGVRLSEGCNPFAVEFIDSFHDNEQGAKRGTNRISILSAEGVRVAHMGDIGHQLDEEAVAKLAGVDVLMIPVGGFYTIDAKNAIEMIERIDPKLVIPMHYRDGDKGLEPIASIDEFLQLAPKQIREKLMLVRGYEESIEV